MATVDFSASLSVPVDSIEAPKPYPTGHYYAIFKDPGWSTKEAKNEKKTPMVELGWELQSADADVDADQLPEGGVQGKSVFNNYTLNNERGMFQLRQALEAVLGDASAGLTLGDCLPQVASQPVLLYLEQEEDNREPGTFVTRVKKVLPVPA